jgi:hypothetical protein
MHTSIPLSTNQYMSIHVIHVTHVEMS